MHSNKNASGFKGGVVPQCFEDGVFICGHKNIKKERCVPVADVFCAD